MAGEYPPSTGSRNDELAGLADDGGAAWEAVVRSDGVEFGPLAGVKIHAKKNCGLLYVRGRPGRRNLKRDIWHSTSMRAPRRGRGG